MKTIGRYEIKSVISESAVGRVYAAVDELLNCSVAIKVLRVGNDVDREQLLASLRTATSDSLAHPGIARVYGCGEHEGRLPYIVMEYLEGENLERRLADRGSLDLFDKVSLMVQLAEALQHAHGKEAIHGKLSPANVIVLKDGTAKILNLGIAGVLRDSSGKRNDLGRLIDELAYKAPEQFEHDDIHRLSDMFSYGVVAYELLTGEHPFRSHGSKDMGRLLRSITTKEPAPIHSLFPECPAALEKVVVRVIQKKPQDRYKSFDDLLEDLRPIFLQIQSETAQGSAREAEALFLRGQLEEARTLLMKALRADAGSEGVNALRRRIQERFETPSIRESRERHFRKGKRALESGEFAEAAQAFRAAIDIDPLEIEVLPLLKRAQTLQASSERATGLFKLAKQEAEKDDLRAAAQLVRQSLTATVEVFSEVQQLYPSAEEIHDVLTLFLKKQSPPS